MLVQFSRIVRKGTYWTGNYVTNGFNDHGFLLVFKTWRFFISSCWEVIESFQFTSNDGNAKGSLGQTRKNFIEGFLDSDSWCQFIDIFILSVTDVELVGLENWMKIVETRNRLLGASYIGRKY
jgi:hypothetical protein